MRKEGIVAAQFHHWDPENCGEERDVKGLVRACFTSFFSIHKVLGVHQDRHHRNFVYESYSALS